MRGIFRFVRRADAAGDRSILACAFADGAAIGFSARVREADKRRVRRKAPTGSPATGSCRRGDGLLLAGDLFDQFGGNTDVAHENVAGVSARLRMREAHFFGDEGDGAGGADAGAGRDAGVAIEAAGDVDGKDGAATVIDGRRDLIEGRAGGVGQTGAEDGVDDQQRICVCDQVGRRGHDHKIHGLGDAPIEQGIAFVMGWIDCQGDLYTRAAIMQMPGDGKAIASIISSAAEDEDLANAIPTEHFTGGVGGRTRGIFHQDDSGDVQILDGPTIHLANLSARQAEHGGTSVFPLRNRATLAFHLLSIPLYSAVPC